MIAMGRHVYSRDSRSWVSLTRRTSPLLAHGSPSAHQRLNDRSTQSALKLAHAARHSRKTEPHASRKLEEQRKQLRPQRVRVLLGVFAAREARVRLVQHQRTVTGSVERSRATAVAPTRVKWRSVCRQFNSPNLRRSKPNWTITVLCSVSHNTKCSNRELQAAQRS